MAIDIRVRHPVLLDKWDDIIKSRDTYKGQTAVKRKKDEYLPKLGGQTQREYEDYIKRAVFYGITPRTVQALTGAITRKDPKIEGLPPQMEEFMQDVDGRGLSFFDFAKQVVLETITSGRCPVVVDRTPDGSGVYLMKYDNESAINWFNAGLDSNMPLSTVIFEEIYLYKDANNPYKLKQQFQYREYTKEVVRIWRKTTGSEGIYKVIQELPLTNKGAPLGFVPVTFVRSCHDEVPMPPLLNLVDANLSHYRNIADLEHGLHWTALPTPWFTGLSDMTEIEMGSGAAIVISDPAGKAGFLEFTGAGLNSLREAIIHKEGLMSAMGARMLAGKMDQSTNPEVARINLSGEVASLAAISESISRGLSQVLKQAALWMGIEKDLDAIKVHLNEDYIDTKLDPAQITALLLAYQGGAMSLDTLLYNFEQGELLSPDSDIETEKANIGADSEDMFEQDLGQFEAEAKIRKDNEQSPGAPIGNL